MGKITLGFLALAILLSAAFMGHAVMSGIAIPYQEPTPEQAAYERYHHSISNPLFMSAGLAWLMAIIFSLVWVALRMIRGASS